MKNQAETPPFSLLQFVRKNPLLSKLEVQYHWGRVNKPVVIMVHGHAVTKKSWINPLKMSIGNSKKDSLGFVKYTTEEVEDFNHLKETLPSGDFIFSTVPRSESHDEILSFWQTLSREGYSLVTWNQRYPNGVIEHALEELELIFELVNSFPLTKDIIFLSHSRGGLVTRRFIQTNPDLMGKVRGMIMLGTPNRGSLMATFAQKFARFRSFPRFVLLARRFLPPALQKEDILQALLAYLTRGIDFLQSEAISQLKRGSPIMKALEKGEEIEKNLKIPYYHLVGTNSQYEKMFYSPAGEDKLVEIPLYFTKLPSLLLPWELVNGKGDGLVAIYRARLGFEKVFEEEWVNHSELLMDRKIQDRVLKYLEEIESQSESD